METFPFAGIGGLAAVAVLVAGYALFAGLVRVLGAAATSAMSVVPGIVTGMRDWVREDAVNTVATTPPAVAWEDLPSGTPPGDQVGAE